MGKRGLCEQKEEAGLVCRAPASFLQRFSLATVGPSCVRFIGLNSLGRGLGLGFFGPAEKSDERPYLALRYSKGRRSALARGWVALNERATATTRVTEYRSAILPGVNQPLARPTSEVMHSATDSLLFEDEEAA